MPDRYVKLTDAEREWLREAAAILNGKEATRDVRRKAASIVRLIADRDQARRERLGRARP